MPFSDLQKSVSCLDNKRLGNQIYREAWTLIKGGWPNHPCSKIWANHKHALAQYCLYGLDELNKRGKYYPKWYKIFQDYLNYPDTGPPPITLIPIFNLSHQSNLIKKDPAYYSPIFGNNIPDNLPYVWSIN